MDSGYAKALGTAAAALTLKVALCHVLAARARLICKEAAQPEDPDPKNKVITTVFKVLYSLSPGWKYILFPLPYILFPLPS
jgi:hypothetical protein